MLCYHLHRFNISAFIVHCISSSLSGLVKEQVSGGSVFERKLSESNVHLIGQFQREISSTHYQQTVVVANVCMGFNLVINAWAV